MTVLFPFRPNWQRPLTTEYAYKTDIIVSRNGTEDRASIRANPRLSFEFETIPMARGEPDGVEADYQTIAAPLPDGTTVFAVALPTVKAGAGDPDLYDRMFPTWQNVDNTLTDRIYGNGVLTKVSGTRMVGVGASGSNNKIYKDYHIDELGIPAREVDRGGVLFKFGGDMVSGGGTGLGAGTGGGGVIIRISALPYEGISFNPTIWDHGPIGAISTSFDDSTTGPSTPVEVSGSLPPGTRYVRVYLRITTDFVLFAESALINIYADAEWTRRAIADEYVPDRPGLAKLQSFLTRNMQEEIYFPEWTRAARTTAALAVDDTIVTLGTPLPVWAAVGEFVLVRHKNNYWLDEIAGQAGGTIILVGGVDQAFPTGAFVHPVHVGMLQGPQAVQALTNTVATSRVRVDVMPDLSPAYAVAAPAVLLNSLEVFLMKPNWTDTLALSWAQEAELVDFDYGRIVVQRPVDINAHTMRFRFDGWTADKVDELIQFFHRQKGRRGTFYVPTWTQDVSVSIGAQNGQSYLVTPGLDLYQDYGSSLTHQAVSVFFRDGTVQVNAVDLIRTAGPNSHIDFASPWTQDISPSTVRMISWTPSCRFATDNLTVEWETNQVATVQMTFMTVKGPQ